jgi:putative transposase
VRKTFKYRLCTARSQSDALEGQLGEACRLYNAALQERRDAWKQRVSVNYYTQAMQLKEIRAAGDLSLANFSCGQDILRRVNKTFEAFFRRVKRGDKAGYPRFQSRRRFDSITFPSYGDGSKLTGNILRVQGVGEIAVKLHRPIAGKIKAVTVQRECGKWYVCFSCIAPEGSRSNQESTERVPTSSFVLADKEFRNDCCRRSELQRHGRRPACQVGSRCQLGCSAL